MGTALIFSWLRKSWLVQASPGNAGLGAARRCSAMPSFATLPTRAPGGIQVHNFMCGRVYFFHNGQHVKIGYTTPALLRRLWQAHVWSPRELSIIGWIETEFPEQLERAIHLELASKRLVKPSGNGEWFDLTISETKQVIESNKHGDILHKTYSNAPGHPAHLIRQIWRVKRDEVTGLGENVYQREWRMRYSNPKRLFAVGGTEYAIGGQAFLR
jgi:hypothetical protein